MNDPQMIIVSADTPSLEGVCVCVVVVVVVVVVVIGMNTVSTLCGTDALNGGTLYKAYINITCRSATMCRHSKISTRRLKRSPSYSIS
jgi:hypothetical protein